MIVQQKPEGFFYGGIKLTNQKEAAEQMLVANTNELIQMELTERLMSRSNIAGALSNEQQLALGKVQKKIKQLKDTITYLRQIVTEAVTESPLADIYEMEQTK